MKTQLSTQDVRAIGFFLSSYEDDLQYMARFRKFIDGNLDVEQYLNNGNFSYTRFISAFRVARNLPLASRVDYLTQVKEFVRVQNLSNTAHESIDAFVTEYRSLTSHDHAYSLASKTLMLWRPVDIYPYDSQAKSFLKNKGSGYLGFWEAANTERNIRKEQVRELLHFIPEYVRTIEKQFESDFENLQAIRETRFFDKIIWSGGKKSKPLA